MILHPDVQRKAQKELDAILIEGRLPNLTDKASLPYIDCILKEVYRWRPVAPLSMVFFPQSFIVFIGLVDAHTSLVDDVYQGCIIPAGSVIMANAWWVYKF